MNREFLDLYNRELQVLDEQAREFADEYPGIAERLGGILADRIDPLIGGLLEGAAFLAGAAAGARRARRQGAFGRHAAPPHAPLGRAPGGRAVGRRGAEEPRTAV